MSDHAGIIGASLLAVLGEAVLLSLIYAPRRTARAVGRLTSR